MLCAAADREVRALDQIDAVAYFAQICKPAETRNGREPDAAQPERYFGRRWMMNTAIGMGALVSLPAPRGDHMRQHLVFEIRIEYALSGGVCMDLTSNKSVTNRSVPASTVIPVLVYEDLGQVVDWLCNSLGFTERLRVGTHRAQFLFGDGAVIVSKRSTSRGFESPNAASLLSPRSNDVSHSVHVRVDDVDRHHERAREHGARILHPPADYPYGERQYTAEDPGGHRWTFSQSIADVAPEEWGATVAKTASASFSSDVQKG